MPPMLIAFFLFTVIYYFSQHFRLRLQLGEIPGPNGFPFIGNVFALTKGGNEGLFSLLKNFRSQYGEKFILWFGLRPYVFLTKDSDIETVLSSKNHTEKTQEYAALLRWLGRGLHTSFGSQWNTRRKLLAPSFHSSKLDGFVQIMCDQGEILVQSLAKSTGQSVDILPLISQTCLDIICEATLGKRIHAQEKPDSSYVKAVARVKELIEYRQFRPWLYNDTIWAWSPSGRAEGKCLQVIHSCVKKAIQDRKAKRKSDGKRNKSKKIVFLDHLLDNQIEDPGEFTDSAILYEINTLMFAGHDSVAANVGWTLFLLGHHPQIQSRVHEEIDSAFGSSESLGNISLGDLSKLKFLEACIKESLRLYPSHPLIGRKLGGELRLGDDIFPPETSVVLMLCNAQDSSFNPDAFLVEKAPKNFFPFSAGPRSCVGQQFAIMETKVILAKVFKKFKVSSLQKIDDLPILSLLFLRPKDGFQLRFQSRE